MNSSTSFIAAYLAIIFIVFGVSLIFNREHFEKLVDELESSHGLQLTFALVPLLLGAYIVLNHNIWAGDRRVVVTIFGWLYLLGGVFRTIFPRTWVSMAKGFINKGTSKWAGTLAGAITFLLGLILFCVAYT